MESKSQKQWNNQQLKQNNREADQGDMTEPKHVSATVPEIMTDIADLFEKISETNNRLIFTEEKELNLLESIRCALKSRTENKSPTSATISRRVRRKATDPDLRNQLAQVISAMRERKATYKEIAQRLNEENRPTLSGRGKWHPASVEKLSPGKTDDFQACRRQIIGLISEMRERNATYKEIADKLNQENRPTFSGRGKWHPASIKQLHPGRDFDYKARRKKINRNSNRQQVMQIISDMRGRNATYQEIAEKLNAEKQPTFSGRGKWHPATIEKLCPRRSIDRKAR